ncbi:uncharacterized protein LOC105697748 [Orussus abietinus]|uniref:uncharacterized protein LOC105697748 n=1 Tax=Orussus abietinus TaxID=222816 RepID=UPI000625590B|nr:uncharacterized protein LOC105697748 [Orussus abietinus]
MSSAGSPTTASSIAAKLGLRPITKCNIVKFYVPLAGVTSYTALSVNVMNPGLVIRIFPQKDITNLLLGSALIGTGTYIYTRDHLKNASTGARAAYSITGAFLLSFGSVLLWAVLRSAIPPNPTLRTLAGIGSGLALAKIGTSYLDFVDAQIVKK